VENRESINSKRISNRFLGGQAGSESVCLCRPVFVAQVLLPVRVSPGIRWVHSQEWLCHCKLTHYGQARFLAHSLTRVLSSFLGSGAAVSSERASRGVAQPGSAPGSGPGGRRFKSSRPDHFSRLFMQRCFPSDWVRLSPNDLVRVIRKIAQIKRRLLKIEEEMHGLIQSEIFQLKTKADEATEAGRALLQEMATAIGVRVSEACVRLARA
jgi:hypothetical protein